MNITLFIDNKEKTFASPFVKARMFRKAISLNKSMNFENLDENDVDTLVSFVCDIFNNQFSIDEFYDGLPANKLMSTITESMNSVVGEVSGDEGNEKK